MRRIAESDVRTVTQQAPTDAEYQQAIHALRGVFSVLDWVTSRNLGDAVTELEVIDVRDTMIIAGGVITQGLIDRF